MQHRHQERTVPCPLVVAVVSQKKRTVFLCSLVVHSCSSSGNVWSQITRFQFSITEHASHTICKRSPANVLIFMGKRAMLIFLHFVKRSSVIFTRQKKQCNFDTAIEMFTQVEKYVLQCNKITALFFSAASWSSVFLHWNCETKQCKTERMFWTEPHSQTQTNRHTLMYRQTATHRYAQIYLYLGIFSTHAFKHRHTLRHTVLAHAYTYTHTHTHQVIIVNVYVRN